MDTILVAGAHGKIGKKIIDILKSSKQFTPVAMVRKEEYVEDFKSQNINVVKADLTENIEHAFKDIDKVIFAAGSGGENVIEVDQEGAKNLIKGAKKSGVKQFVMLSSMGADSPEDADQLQDYLKAKHNADQFLKQSGLNYTIVRPGTLNNDKGAGKIKLETKLNEQGKISRDDVAQVLVGSLQDDLPKDVTFEVISGENLISSALQQL